MKRLTAMVLTLALCGLLLSTAALAADPTLTVETVSAWTGDTVELTVTLSGNQGLGGYQGVVRYDPAALELLGGAGGAAYPGLSFSMNTTTAMFLAYASGSGVDGDNVLFTLRFLVRDIAPAGESAVTLDELLVIDKRLREYAVTAVAGGVTVLAEGEEPPADPASGPTLAPAVPTSRPTLTLAPADPTSGPTLAPAAPTATPTQTPAPARTFSLGGTAAPGPTAAGGAPVTAVPEETALPAPDAAPEPGQTPDPDRTEPELTPEETALAPAEPGQTPGTEPAAEERPASEQTAEPAAGTAAPEPAPEAERTGAVPAWIWIAAALLLGALAAGWLLIRGRSRDDGA